ncbi:oligosaccharide flippase family protein [Sphingobium sp. H39-3-25]|uniref:oligosaccharide flippase family protein n=1 Tax=Sphingobium arseniciresistens TaxID=3030834 RepID=UPI0023B9B835|nr:oligosaccharide flippase family protein [Sphingobium arseniciresistens]
MSLKRSLAWMGLAQLLSFALQFASTIVVARYLTAHESGIYAAALALVGILSLIQTMGLPALIVREATLTDEVKISAFTVNALVSLLLCVAIAGLSFGGEALLGDAGVRHALLGLAPTPLFAIFSFLPAAMLEREGNFKTIALVGTMGSIASAAVVITAAIAGMSYMSVVFGQWANAAALAIGMNIMGRHHVALQTSLRGWRRVADFALQMLAVTGINNLSTRLSDVLLGYFAGLSALGLFNRASAINILLWNNIHLFIGRVMLVDYAVLVREGQSLRDRYIRTVAMITALLWPLFFGIAVLAGPIVVTLLGDRWIEAATPLALLALSSALLAAITMTWELFAATDRMRTQTRIEMIRSIVALAAFAAGCLISLNAAASARILDAVFAIVLYRKHINDMTDTRTRDFTGIYLRSLGLAALACGPAAAIMAAYRWSAHTPLTLLAPGVMLGIILWIAGLYALRHPLWQEVGGVIATRLGSRKVPREAG